MFESLRWRRSFSYWCHLGFLWASFRCLLFSIGFLSVAVWFLSRFPKFHMCNVFLANQSTESSSSSPCLGPLTPPSSARRFRRRSPGDRRRKTMKNIKTNAHFESESVFYRVSNRFSHSLERSRGRESPGAPPTKKKWR